VKSLNVKYNHIANKTVAIREVTMRNSDILHFQIPTDLSDIQQYAIEKYGRRRKSADADAKMTAFVHL